MFNNEYSFERSWVVFVETIFASYVLSMLVEVPFMTILKHYTAPKKKEKLPVTTTTDTY